MELKNRAKFYYTDKNKNCAVAMLLASNDVYELGFDEDPIPVSSIHGTGSGDLLDKITQVLGLPSGSTTPDGKYSLEATRCIGACGLAPVLTVNNEVYGKLGVNDIEGILAKYK